MAKSTKLINHRLSVIGSTSYRETAFGILSRSKVVNLEKQGVKRAQQYIIKLSAGKTKITPQLILGVHKAGFEFIFPDWAGRFRTINVTVGSYEPPHYSKVMELISSLCDDLEERLKHLPSQKNEEKYLAEIISILSWFQHRLVWIHPFKDYNGRVARLLTNLLALNLGLPLLAIKAETSKDREYYIKAMKDADQDDYSKLEKLIANALKEGMEQV